MLWEGRPLREIGEADIRAVINSGLEEHIQLEYKSELYEDNHAGKREFLLDVCMFANTLGGILLIGIPERRENGQPSGVPDATATIGLELSNPEAILAAYDSRVMESIEERLSLESAATDVGNGRCVLALRVPNSTRKPHSVRREGHIYFPARRERQRYPMTVHDIKELVMRTASRLERTEELLRTSIENSSIREPFPYLLIEIAPVFFESFLVDVKSEAAVNAVGRFNRAEQIEFVQPIYTFYGLQRREERWDYFVTLNRNGLIASVRQLPLLEKAPGVINDTFTVSAIDISLRRFLQRASAAYEALRVGGPYLLGMQIRASHPLQGAYPTGFGQGYYATPFIAAGNYSFPFVQIDDLSHIDQIIRPLCDQAHHMFGKSSSPNFNAEGAWVGRYY
jgi:hypothetical protein